MLALFMTTLLSCRIEAKTPLETGTPSPVLGPEDFVLQGGMVVGSDATAVEVRGGVITALGTVDPTLPVIDTTGRFLVAAWIDSHVHLAYREEADALARGGIAAAVDLAAPLEFLETLPSKPHVLASGPMITAVGGYPTESWGRNGYGLECKGADAARKAVAQLHKAGVGVIKVAITSSPSLGDAELLAIVAEAHARGLKVAAHAVGNDEALRAAKAGVDVLAHTPVEALTDETIAAWKSRTVISTLSAFGGSGTAVRNLQALRAAGATVLYGTDFGNTTTAGIDGNEIDLLLEAGLDDAAILAAATTTPAAFWGLQTFGHIEVSRQARILVLDADPRKDVRTVTRPVAVY